jgi:hypothetical protein
VIEVIPNIEGKGPDTYEPGRVCESCPTTLSIYNPRRRCAQCDPIDQRLSLRQHREAMFSLAEFMEES